MAADSEAVALVYGSSKAKKITISTIWQTDDDRRSDAVWWHNVWWQTGWNCGGSGSPDSAGRLLYRQDQDQAGHKLATMKIY